MNNVLEINNITKDYKKFKIDNISFNLPKGYIMGFIGANGAGKTTTIKLILNMIKRDSGEIKVFGLDNIREEERIKEQIGVVFDECYYLEDWTLNDVEKAVSMFYKNWNSSIYEKYLKEFNLARDKKVKDLSRGMRMKLMIAVAFSHEAKLLILDEPTSGLDPVARDEFLDILRDYIEDEEKSVIFSSHITSDIEKIADYITYINNGKIIFTGEKDEFLEKYCIIKGGKEDITESQKKEIRFNHLAVREERSRYFMDEVLDERKRKILKAIIKTYMETGEPVGSRTISKYPDLNVSSATIRNEMSDLTDMGYIVQPHTSAGRIPSDKGYRLYVDELTREKEAEIAEIRDLMIEKSDKMDKVLKQVAKVLATNTNYAAMVAVPQYKGSTLKFIQLSRVNERQLIAVVVCEGNVIRNQIINIDEEMDDQTILKLNLLLNTNLNGVPIQDINLGMIARLKEQAGSHSGVVADVLDAVAATIHVDEEDMKVYTSGATNIFKYPELADTSRASELISTFEDKQELADMVREEMGDPENTGVQVYIGDEVPVRTMKDCSVVTATYELGDGMRGTIGIIGPKRMDYENVVDSLKKLKVQLDEMVNKKT